LIGETTKERGIFKKSYIARQLGDKKQKRRRKCLFSVNSETLDLKRRVRKPRNVEMNERKEDKEKELEGGKS